MLYPTVLRKACISIGRLLEYIYTGYCSRNIKKIGYNSKFCFPIRLVGNQYIEIGDNVILGRGCSLTAFCIDNKSNKTIIEIKNNCLYLKDLAYGYMLVLYFLLFYCLKTIIVL